jgi:hypothetical protein
LPDPLVPFWQCKCLAVDPHLFNFINKAGIRNDFVELLQGLRFFANYFLLRNSRARDEKRVVERGTISKSNSLACSMHSNTRNPR